MATLNSVAVNVSSYNRADIRMQCLDVASRLFDRNDMDLDHIKRIVDDLERIVLEPVRDDLEKAQKIAKKGSEPYMMVSGGALEMTGHVDVPGPLPPIYDLGMRQEC